MHIPLVPSFLREHRASYPSSELPEPFSRERKQLSWFERAVQQARRVGPTLALLGLLAPSDVVSKEAPTSEQQPLVLDCRTDAAQPGERHVLTHEIIEEEAGFAIPRGETIDPQEEENMKQQIREAIQHHLKMYADLGLDPLEIIESIQTTAIGMRDPGYGSLREDERLALVNAQRLVRLTQDVLEEEGLGSVSQESLTHTEYTEGAVELFGRSLYPFGFVMRGESGTEHRQHVEKVVTALRAGDRNALRYLLPRLNERFLQLQELYKQSWLPYQEVRLQIDFHLREVVAVTDPDAPVLSMLFSIAGQRPVLEKHQLFD